MSRVQIGPRNSEPNHQPKPLRPLLCARPALMSESVNQPTAYSPEVCRAFIVQWNKPDRIRLLNYGWRHSLCGVCGNPLPEDRLFTPAEAKAVTRLLSMEKQRYRRWLSKGFAQALAILV